MRHAATARIVLTAGLLVSTVWTGQAQDRTRAGAITANGLRADIFFLASDELAGRESLSREGRIAADFIAAEFMRLGLTPIANGTFFQDFPMTSAIVDRAETALVATSARSSVAREKTFQIGVDFNVPPQSNSPASVDAPLVFVGFGVTAPEYQYDDYAGIDVGGKVVMMLTHEPQESSPSSRFKGRWQTYHAYNRYKIEVARLHGAAGVLIVNEWVPHRPPMTPSGARPVGQPSYALASSYLDLPVFTISREAANELLRTSGRTIEQLKEGIDASGTPASFAVTDTTVSMNKAFAERRVVQTRNVVGLLEGSDPALRSEAVAITAHYDHVGVSGDRIYHGADDNASGTAGVLEIARAFARSPERPKRSILFLVFEAEERGLLGAFQYVERPLVPLDKTVAVLNMDMIGRDEDSPTWNTRAADNKNGLNIVGTLYNPDLRKVIEAENKDIGLTLDYKTDGDDRESWFSRSDHFPFAIRGVPMVLFNTGEHPDYHTENDTWDRINYEKMERIVRLIHGTAATVANAPGRPAFVR